MNKDQLISAIGDIDESYIAEAHKDNNLNDKAYAQTI